MPENELNRPYWQSRAIAEQVLASLASLNQQLGNRVDRHIGNAADRTHGRPFAQHGKDLDALGEGQLVHANSI
jgi:hypothetical protein